MNKPHIEFKGMKIEVKILEEKNSYGHTEYVITPIAGEGIITVRNIKGLTK